jgi:hypothetical protein
MTDTPFISDKRDRDEDEHDDQDNALFVLREFENSEQVFHFTGVMSSLRVMLSKALQRDAKHEARLSNISSFRHIIGD